MSDVGGGPKLLQNHTHPARSAGFSIGAALRALYFWPNSSFEDELKGCVGERDEGAVCYVS